MCDQIAPRSRTVGSICALFRGRRRVLTVLVRVGRRRRGVDNDWTGLLVWRSSRCRYNDRDAVRERRGAGARFAFVRARGSGGSSCCYAVGIWLRGVGQIGLRLRVQQAWQAPVLVVVLGKARRLPLGTGAGTRVGAATRTGGTAGQGQVGLFGAKDVGELLADWGGRSLGVFLGRLQA